MVLGTTDDGVVVDVDDDPLGEGITTPTKPETPKPHQENQNEPTTEPPSPLTSPSLISRRSDEEVKLLIDEVRSNRDTLEELRERISVYEGDQRLRRELLAPVLERGVPRKLGVKKNTSINITFDDDKMISYFMDEMGLIHRIDAIRFLMRYGLEQWTKNMGLIDTVRSLTRDVRELQDRYRTLEEMLE